MWWLNLIPTSCEEIGCMVIQCLFHLCINPMWCGSPARWTIVQSQPFFIRCHLVLCLLYRRYFVQCSSDLQIGFRLRFALSKSDAVGLNSLVRFPNRMLFAFGFLIADFNLHNRSVHVCKLDLGLQIGCICLLLRDSFVSHKICRLSLNEICLLHPMRSVVVHSRMVFHLMRKKFTWCCLTNP